MIDSKLFKNNQFLKDLPPHLEEKIGRIKGLILSIPELKISQDSLDLFLMDIVRSIEEQKFLDLVITTCPDYSFDPVTEKYTFEGINDGPGLVAKKSLRVLIKLAQLFEQEGVHSRLRFIYADQEAFDEDILEGMNETTESFLEKIERSKLKIFLLARQTLSDMGIRNFVNVDIQNMREGFITPDSLDFAKDIINTTLLNGKGGSSTIDGLIYARRNLISTMFSKNPHKDRKAFSRKRALIDLEDHIALGHAVRGMRRDGNLITIFTMSINELATHHNPPGIDRVPVIQIQNNY